ncbi:MAG: RNA ligase family protein [Myxococcota bacterium]
MFTKHRVSLFPKMPHYQQDADLIHSVRRVVCMEKIDGTNTRIAVHSEVAGPDGITIGGRTLLEGEPGFAHNV